MNYTCYILQNSSATFNYFVTLLMLSTYAVFIFVLLITIMYSELLHISNLTGVVLF